MAKENVQLQKEQTKTVSVPDATGISDDTSEKTAKQLCVDYALGIITQVIDGKMPMSVARQSMHSWWKDNRDKDTARKQAVEFRELLSRVSMIAGELHTEYMVASQLDR